MFLFHQSVLVEETEISIFIELRENTKERNKKSKTK